METRADPAASSDKVRGLRSGPVGPVQWNLAIVAKRASDVAKRVTTLCGDLSLTDSPIVSVSVVLFRRYLVSKSAKALVFHFTVPYVRVRTLF